MKNKLAIIIPAYKACFFREVLDSIVRQSNRDFTVYIGDDASPDDLESIVFDYKDKLDIFYFRFEQNWGGRDLVAHWERCIELSDEPLVWLFSDDDLMPPDAVERVIKVWKKSGECDAVFRFPLAIVDAYGELKYTNPPFEPERISGYEFLLLGFLWHGVQMMQHGQSLRIMHLVLFHYRELLFIGGMLKIRI